MKIDTRLCVYPVLNSFSEMQSKMSNFRKCQKTVLKFYFFSNFLYPYENLRNTLSPETKNENAQLRMKKKKKLVFGKDTNKSAFRIYHLVFKSSKVRINLKIISRSLVVTIHSFEVGEDILYILN